jgi:hypothetical protein
MGDPSHAEEEVVKPVLCLGLPILLDMIRDSA